MSIAGFESIICDDDMENNIILSESKRGKDFVASKNGVTVYKLGDEIKNGVVYFGQEQRDKFRFLTAICICPLCGGTWRVKLSAIRIGQTKSCCNRGIKTEKKSFESNRVLVKIKEDEMIKAFLKKGTK